MNNDDNLIFETYLKESAVKRAALSLVCAIGIGCSSVPKDQQPNKEIDRDTQFFHDMLQGILPFVISLKKDKKLTPDIEAKFLNEVENIMATKGTPEEGWERWVNNWLIDNV